MHFKVYCPKMSEKHRNLPVWMVKSNVGPSKDKDAETKERTKRRAKKRLKRVVTYWMNETELVETAVAVLKDEPTHARAAVQGPEEETVIPETDEDTTDSEVQDRTHVSHIAELETVPYANCVEESTSRKPDCHGVDDEALELVREIFFT